MKYLRPLNIKCEYCGRREWQSAFGHLYEFGGKWFCNHSVCYDRWLFDKRGYGVVIMPDSAIERAILQSKLDEIERRHRERDTPR